MAKLHDFYKDTVVSDLQTKFDYKSVMQVPRIEKITLNMGAQANACIERQHAYPARYHAS